MATGARVARACSTCGWSAAEPPGACWAPGCALQGAIRDHINAARAKHGLPLLAGVDDGQPPVAPASIVTAPRRPWHWRIKRMVAAMVDWTDERVGRLVRMWSAGFSARQIADDMGDVTRNAVLGRVHRMGLKSPKPPRAAAATAAKRKRAAPTATAKPFPQTAHPRPFPQHPRPAPICEPVQPPPAGGVTIMDLTPNICRWPFGEPRQPDFRFCGGGTRQGVPYCRDHMLAAYRPDERRRTA
ncbi:GcrA family cell cycle regulator [Chelatococcus reniformis]|uniref:GcrA cell cycle regulator n=1 Tax=Chelatococcus reniformis TaxID=1494448 RepID=A0A916UF11_9HYPH|nr:GcrA family cell cycle regulator [Chelatococcus reniformis]GGC70557.1 hypothetical protein GCM10010994_31390 [Chelatococcus reniformis]